MEGLNLKQAAADVLKKGGAAFDTFVDGVANVAGVEKAEGLSGKEMFSGVMKDRTEHEVDDFFAMGTRHGTPDLKEIKAEWPKPWFFIKVLGFLSLICGLFIWGYVRNPTSNIVLIPGLLLLGGFAVPVSTLIFFIEINVPRNVSMNQLLRLLMLGGISSILLTLTLDAYLSSKSMFFGAILTGLVEEVAKMATVIRLMRNSRYTWTLNGLLIGAAVGTGFAAFESAGYILGAALGSGESSMFFTLFLRALLCPFGHIVWTGAAAAAFWKVKGKQEFKWKMLGDLRFLRVLGIVIVLHSIWDMSMPFLILEVLKWVILGVVAWIIVIGYIQEGLKEIRQAQQGEDESKKTAQDLVVVAN